jgi:hypothetical protein
VNVFDVIAIFREHKLGSYLKSQVLASVHIFVVSFVFVFLVIFKSKLLKPTNQQRKCLKSLLQLHLKEIMEIDSTHVWKFSSWGFTSHSFIKSEQRPHLSLLIDLLLERLAIIEKTLKNFAPDSYLN